MVKKGLQIFSLMVLTLVTLTGSSIPRISVLTCSPGQALYTGFGHSALRLQDTLNGKPVDLIFNYGTFRFTEEFYVEFAQGRLDYFLSVSPFYEFQETYLYEGRGIQEQYLMMSQQDLEKLSALLIENADPKNATFDIIFSLIIVLSGSGKSLKKHLPNRCPFLMRPTMSLSEPPSIII